MKSKALLIAALTGALSSLVAPAAESTWPTGSADQLAVFLTLQLVQPYADQCSIAVPEMKPKFTALVENVNGRLQVIAKELLASDSFKGMKDESVPPQVVADLKRDFEKAAIFKIENPASDCPRQFLAAAIVQDDTLRSSLKTLFSNVQNLIDAQRPSSAR